MLQVEEIRAELKRRMLQDYNSGDEDADAVAQGVCAGILSFIDTHAGNSPSATPV